MSLVLNNGDFNFIIYSFYTIEILFVGLLVYIRVDQITYLNILSKIRLLNKLIVQTKFSRPMPKKKLMPKISQI